MKLVEKRIWKRGGWLALACAPVLAVLATEARSGGGAGDPVVIMPFIGIQHEPLLIYEISGGTLLGPVRRTLTVYDSGSAHFSQLVPSPLLESAGAVFGDGSSGTSTYFSVTFDDVQLLARQLVRVGADDAQDGSLLVADVPLTTVTFFKNPGTDASAHTFSFFLSDPQQAAAVDVIEEFLDAHGF